MHDDYTLSKICFMCRMEKKKREKNWKMAESEKIVPGVSARPWISIRLRIVLCCRERGEPVPPWYLPTALTCFAGFTYGNDSLVEFRGSFISPPGHKIEDWNPELPATAEGSNNALLCISPSSFLPFYSATTEQAKKFAFFLSPGWFGDNCGYFLNSVRF